MESMRKLSTFVFIALVLGTITLSWRTTTVINPELSVHDTTRINLHDTLQIEEVSVTASPLTPEEKLLQRQDDYRIIYLNGDYSNIFEQMTISQIGITVFLNGNKVYNRFSASGKEARLLQEMIQDEFEEDKINEVWIPMTAQYTGLRGQDLADFRRYYRPYYADFANMQQEDRLDYLIRSVKNFKDSAEYIRAYLELPQ